MTRQMNAIVLVPCDLSFDQVNHIFRDVRCMIGDPLDMS
jgi:hypothetical protein